jgi:hypothetical protein
VVYLRHYTAICLEGPRKGTKISVKVAGFRAEIQPGTSRTRSKSANNSVAMFGPHFVEVAEIADVSEKFQDTFR